LLVAWCSEYCGYNGPAVVGPTWRQGGFNSRGKNYFFSQIYLIFRIRFKLLIGSALSVHREKVTAKKDKKKQASKKNAGINISIASPLGVAATCEFFLCVRMHLMLLPIKYHFHSTNTFRFVGSGVKCTFWHLFLEGQKPVPFCKNFQRPDFFLCVWLCLMMQFLQSTKF